MVRVSVVKLNGPDQFRFVYVGLVIILLVVLLIPIITMSLEREKFYEAHANLNMDVVIKSTGNETVQDARQLHPNQEQSYKKFIY